MREPRRIHVRLVAVTVAPIPEMIRLCARPLRLYLVFVIVVALPNRYRPSPHPLIAAPPRHPRLLPEYLVDIDLDIVRHGLS